MHPLYGALPVAYVLLHLIRMRLLAAEPRRTARRLLPSQYLCRIFLRTPNWMMWDYRVLQEGQMFFSLYNNVKF